PRDGTGRGAQGGGHGDAAAMVAGRWRLRAALPNGSDHRANARWDASHDAPHERADARHRPDAGGQAALIRSIIRREVEDRRRDAGSDLDRDLLMRREHDGAGVAEVASAIDVHRHGALIAGHVARRERLAPDVEVLA